MKRKLDKNKIYTFIGKTVVFLSANLMWTGLIILGFMQNTIYQEEVMGKIVTQAIVTIVMIICLIFWHKKINSTTTWIYGIYCLTVEVIFSIFAWTIL